MNCTACPPVNCFRTMLGVLLIVGLSTSRATPLESKSAVPDARGISTGQLGVVATQQYSGDGLSVTATPEGVRLRCAFQRLEGVVTSKGLWLQSMGDDAPGDRFRVCAVAVRRASDFGVRWQSAVATPLWSNEDEFSASRWESSMATRSPFNPRTLPTEGLVRVDEQTAQFERPGLTEEYAVSVDGVRQDFIIEQRPEGDGELRLELEVTGATAQPLLDGVRLALGDGGRRLIYNRLSVLDARGRELPARFEVAVANEVVVVVDDAAAQYPVRIDPTFSDADWVSMGGIPGANGEILAAAADGSGNIYVGGNFTAAGEVSAMRVAKWDGSGWSALGEGMANGAVFTLLVSGSDLYAGGTFTKVGTNTALQVAKWNGSTWTNLGSGLTPSGNGVRALAMVGGDLYVGGDFTRAGGVAVTNIARWDGNGWSAVGEGSRYAVFTMVATDTDLYAGGSACWLRRWDGVAWSDLGSGLGGDYVTCLALSGDDLYAGGAVYFADGAPVNHIAKWDGIVWSGVGNGLSDDPRALAIHGADLYAAVAFGGSTVARWNGSTWSNLATTGDGYFVANELLVVNGSLHAAGGGGGGSVGRVVRLDGSAWVALSQGVTSNILALAVMGNDLYAGGRFKTAGGQLVNHIAKWDGSTWSPLGSGVSTTVYALTVSGTKLYAGGAFTNAGGTPANRVARWDGNAWSALGT